MRARFTFLTAAILLLLLTGCPQGEYRFRNAATNAGWRGLLGGLDGIYAALAPSAETGDQQPREVVEPDVIRRVGNVLYVLNQYRGLTVVDLEQQKVLGRAPTYGYPRDLYVVGNRAYVIVGQASDYKIEGNTISSTISSRLYVIDLQNLSNQDVPQFAFNGDLVDSRLVGDVLYAVCGESQLVGVSGGGVAIAKDPTSSSWVTSINVADPNHIYQADEVSFEGLGSVIQATNFAIFVAAPDWNSNSTAITYVDISDPVGAIQVNGHIVVGGYVADRFKMDAYEGVLRVVSNDGNWQTGRRNIITTVSLADPNNLVKLGQTELLDAAGETLFATRFDGPRAYIVTYLVKDPLFIVDLSDPTNPTVTGKLVIPGWSTYIEPQGNRLTALGVDDTNGRRVAVSMFNVADPANPTQIGDKATFGDDWSWSTAYNDVKAFTVLEDVVIVPVSGWTNAGSYERLQFVSYSDAGPVARGFVDLKGSVLRSLKYGDRYYGVTSEQLGVIDASDLDHPLLEKGLPLAEYVADFIPLVQGTDVEVITGYSSAQTLVRTVDAEEDTIGEVAVEIGSFVKAYPYGQSVVLVGTAYDDATYGNAYYLVAAVDCAQPQTPTAGAPVKVDVQPYYGYYWYGYGEDWRVSAIASTATVGAPEAGAKLMYAPWIPWWTPPGDTTFLLGDLLALRCSNADFDVTFGSETAYQGLALVDLATLTRASTIGLGYGNIVSLDAAGDKLYLGTRQDAGTALVNPLVANFLQVLDVKEMTVGPATNVPGTFVQYDPGQQRLTIRDDQWTGLWNVATTLRTMAWDGASEVALLDEVGLPNNVSTILGRGSKIYVSTYPYYGPVPLFGIGAAASDRDAGYYLYAVSMDADGDLHLGDALLVTKEWAGLLDAHADTAYVTISNAVAIYDFSDGGDLKDVIESMGSPMSIRFGADYAYAALGYSGATKLPL